MKGNGASLRSAASKKKLEDTRPTPDQLFLAEKLNGGDWTIEDTTARNAITIPALQRWNTAYGVVRVSDALRVAWGFPPLEGIENPYAYVQGILKGA